MTVGTLSNIVPDGEDWVARALADLRRQLDELRGARTLEASGVGEGGITIGNAGSLRVVDQNDVEIARFGALTSPTWDESDGTPQPGVQFLREDGSTAMFLGDLNPTTPPFKQSMQIMDRGGRVIFADDTNGGTGIARPYLPLAQFEDTTVPTATTTSSTFAQLQYGDCYMQHPKTTAAVIVRTDSGTAGEVRMTVDNLQIGLVTAVPAASFGVFLINSTPSVWPGTSYSFLRRATLAIEARRTSGTGTVGVRSLGAWGVQS